MMKKNVGFADSVVRVVFAMAFLSLWLMEIVGGVPALLLVMLSTMFIATSIVGYCPLYSMLGVSTEVNGEERNEKSTESFL